MNFNIVFSLFHILSNCLRRPFTIDANVGSYTQAVCL